MSNKICGVYVWTHLPDGRKYIGSSTDCLRRKREHLLSIASGKGHHFHRKAAKLGIENFAFSVVEVCAPNDRFVREAFYIKTLESVFPKGFNIRRDPTETWSYARSPELLAAQSAAMKGKKLSLETRAKIGASHQGQKRTKEARAKMSAAQRGRKVSHEARAKISAALKGRKLSQEVRANMSFARIVSWASRRAAKSKSITSSKNSGKNQLCWCSLANIFAIMRK